MLIRHRLLLYFVLLASIAPGGAWAQAVQWQSYQQVALTGVQLKQNKASSAAEAARIAQRRYGGKILKVETERTDDGVRYRVKILQDDGRVRTVVISG
ncbi:MAG: PepSY domain-containing protein [Cellvibrionaceae bacterium]